MPPTGDASDNPESAKSRGPPVPLDWRMGATFFLAATAQVLALVRAFTISVEELKPGSIWNGPERSFSVRLI